MVSAIQVGGTSVRVVLLQILLTCRITLGPLTGATG